MRLFAFVVLVAILSPSFGWQFKRLLNQNDLTTINHEIRIELQQKNMEFLRKINEQVSNPKHPMFGKYLTTKQVREIVGQDDRVLNKVTSWIESTCSQICPITTRVGAHADYVYAKTCLSRVQCMFNTEFVAYGVENVDDELYRSVELFDPQNLDQFGVPYNLRQYIFRIMHVADFPVLSRIQKRFNSEQPEFQGATITPLVIQANYEVDQYSTPTGNGSQGSQGCAEFQRNYWRPQDLLDFQDKYGEPENNVTNIIGTDSWASSGSFIEASLDFQYISSVVPLETWGYIQSGYSFDLIEYCEAIEGTENAAYVQSVSYGEQENDFGKQNAFRTSDEFMKLTTEGFTFLVASGDDATGENNNGCSKFEPLFPAVSPYVTAVGATYLKSSSGTGECSIYFSGSGFSNFFTRPSWQDDAIEGYFDSGVDFPSSSQYNSSGRGIPDVAAYGTNYEVNVKGRYELVAGTSAATPTFAAMVGWGNVKRQEMGLAPLGNINPRLYQSGQVGTDITCGDSKSASCSDGFDTATGWDAATGLGTPLASVLYSVLTSD